MSSPPPLTYALLPASDLPLAFTLESSSFPPDEAATLASLTTRQSTAGHLFLAAYLPSASTGELVGFICATLTPSDTLTHDSMSTHVPAAPFVAIHSVCVSPEHRRKGIALALLEEYRSRLMELSRTEGVRGARLIAHEELIPLYEKAGFTLVGRSDVQHGARPWYQLKLDFPSPTSPPSPPNTAAEAEDYDDEDAGHVVRSLGLPLSRLLRPSTSSSPSTTFESLLVDSETGLNKADLYCPVPECRCLLLRRGTGKYVKGLAKDLELPALPRPINAPTPPPSASSSSSQHPQTPQAYWSLPSPLSFENIGFSRSVLPPSSLSSLPPTPSSAATIKYLTCADCDTGPLGWHDTEGRDLGVEVQEENERRSSGGTRVREGREFLLDVRRVRYKLE